MSDRIFTAMIEVVNKTFAAVIEAVIKCVLNTISARKVTKILNS